MDITRTSGKRVNAGQGELVTAGGNQTTVRKSWKTLAAVVLGLVLSVPELSQAQYVFTDIDVPGATATAANANSTHEIAGQFAGMDGIFHGFVLNKGVFTTIDFPGAVATVVNPDLTIVTIINGINARGQLTGTYGDGTKIHSLRLGEGRLHHARPARLERIARRLPQRAGQGRGRLQGPQRQTSRLHLEQWRLHHN